MKNTISIILFLFISININSTAFATESQMKFFVSLTTDDLDRAAMAVGISSKVLSTRKIPVTIFLSAQGVRWADKNIPQNRHVSGKTVPEMLKHFIASGGQVIICKMCMKNVGGLKKEEVLEGIKFTGTLDALFADNTTVLSY
jgi:predicted peroxiredoxin